MKDNNYFVYEHITPDGMYYIGVTTDIKKRWKTKGYDYRTTSLQPYIDKYGWDNIQHQILFENQTKENALWIEDFLIRTASEDGVCINKNRSGLVSKEDGYFQQYNKQYREEHQDYFKEQNKKYREEHRDYYKEYGKRYRQRKKQNSQLKELGYIPLF